MPGELDMTKEIVLLITGGVIGLISSLVTTLVIWHIHSKTQTKEWERQGKLRKADRKKIQTDTGSLKRSVIEEPFDTELENAKLKIDAANESVAIVKIIGGTHITLADKSQKSVEELKAGMELLVYDDHTLINSTTKIIEIDPDETRRYVVINDEIKLTDTNRVATDKGIKDAFGIVAGDAILRQDNLYKEVKIIQLKYGKTTTYNIKLENVCGIFAEKYCVADILF